GFKKSKTVVAPAVKSTITVVAQGKEKSVATLGTPPVVASFGDSAGGSSSDVGSSGRDDQRKGPSEVSDAVLLTRMHAMLGNMSLADRRSFLGVEDSLANASTPRMSVGRGSGTVGRSAG
ncbi:unnamed protein product, partial [Pylaiella littoralis]